MRKYRPIWDEIKAKESAEVTVGKHLVATLIQGVKKIKSEENASRSSVGLIPYAKLVITTETASETRKLVKVRFSLFYSIYL